MGLLDCARRLNLSLNTVKRYDRASEPERLQRVPKYRPTLAGPHRDYLRKRRAEEPGVPLQQLLREIRERGYQGSSSLLVRYVNQGRVDRDRPHLAPRRAARPLPQPPTFIWGRRSLFRLRGNPLLVCEMFLPGIGEDCPRSASPSPGPAASNSDSVPPFPDCITHQCRLTR